MDSMGASVVIWTGRAVCDLADLTREAIRGTTLPCEEDRDLPCDRSFSKFKFVRRAKEREKHGQTIKHFVNIDLVVVALGGRRF